MRLLLFVGAVVSLGLAGWNFNAVIDELRRSLPPQFNELDLRRAVGIHIWTPAVSDTARLRFVWSNLLASVSFSLGAILLWTSGELNGAALFGGLAVLVIAYIAWQSYRYWVRGQQN
jgi:hypothetical protein